MSMWAFYDFSHKKVKLKIFLSFGGYVLSKEGFNSSWPKPANKPDVSFDTYYVDGDYKLVVLDNENLDVELTSIFGGKPFTASFRLLSPTDKRSIYANAGDAAAINELSALPLQVSAEIVEGEIKTAAIIGLGEMREGAVSMHEAKEKSKDVPGGSRTMEKRASLLE